jgi:hypothetical protein
MRHQKTLTDLTEAELQIVEELVALLQRLPDNPMLYLKAVGELKKDRKIRNRIRGEITRGYGSSRQIRATDNKW